jgi:purine-binding chemotaxis protein CheW
MKNFDKEPHVERLNMPISNTGDMNQYLTFTVGQEEYGAEILRVQEVTGYAAITPIPNAPPHVRGVMNLRGTIIPVIDLRRRLGLAPVEYHRGNAIVVVNAGAKVRGLLVDVVTDVRTFPKSAIEAAPDFGSDRESRSITGLAKVEEKVVLILDLDEILGVREASVSRP